MTSLVIQHGDIFYGMPDCRQALQPFIVFERVLHILRTQFTKHVHKHKQVDAIIHIFKFYVRNKLLKFCWNSVEILLKFCWNYLLKFEKHWKHAVKQRFVHMFSLLKFCWNFVELLLKFCWSFEDQKHLTIPYFFSDSLLETFVLLCKVASPLWFHIFP